MTHESESPPSTEPFPFEAPPRSERIVVVVDEPPARIGSLHMPDNVRDRPSSGIVVELGSLAPPEYLGRRIVFGQSSGVRVKIASAFFLVLTPDDVLGLMPPGTPPPWDNDAAA